MDKRVIESIYWDCYWRFWRFYYDFFCGFSTMKNAFDCWKKVVSGKYDKRFNRYLWFYLSAGYWDFFNK